MNNEPGPWARLFVCLVAILTFGGLWVVSYQDCARKGGALVESACTMQCVEVKR